MGLCKKSQIIPYRIAAIFFSFSLDLGANIGRFRRGRRPEARDRRPDTRGQRPEATRPEPGDQRPEAKGQRLEATGYEARSQREEARGQEVGGAKKVKKQLQGPMQGKSNPHHFKTWLPFHTKRPLSKKTRFSPKQNTYFRRGQDSPSPTPVWRAKQKS